MWLPGTNAEQFIVDLIRASEWDLRYSPEGKPYAALLNGFGNGEAGIKLHFYPSRGAVRVVGVIDRSEEIGLRRPFVFVSIYRGIHEALRLINNMLLPRYKRVWYEAQPKLQALPPLDD